MTREIWGERRRILNHYFRCRYCHKLLQKEIRRYVSQTHPVAYIGGERSKGWLRWRTEKTENHYRHGNLLEENNDKTPINQGKNDKQVNRAARENNAERLVSRETIAREEEKAGYDIREMKERKQRKEKTNLEMLNIGGFLDKMTASIMEKEDFATQLRDACERAGRKLDMVFEEENLEKLVMYAEELRFWNRAYNLVGRKIGTEGLVSLIVDAISPLSLKGLLEEGREVVDIGSGAGLPGIPLFLLAGPFPLTVVESQRKKITFLRHACRKLGLEKVKIYPGRLEDMTKEEDNLSAYEVALARAVMDPMRLLKSAELLISEGGRLILFVGKNDAERIRKASLNLNEKGLKVEAIRSTQRIVGKENFLAVIAKTRP